VTELRIEGLRAGYRDTEVLRGVDLTVPERMLTAVLGPSGCGKTTLLRAIVGFLRVRAGTIEVGGTTVSGPGTHLPPERRRIAVVPQEGALFPHLTVAANVGFGRPGMSLSRRRDRRRKVAELLELVGLSEYAGRRPHELSGGQQQRVALARALAADPAVVLLDEPFSALDAGLRAEVRTDVRRALADAGATAVLVTHDQDEALSIADQVAVLRAGVIHQVGAPAEVYQRPRDSEVATFLGDAVLLSATADGTRAETPVGRVSLLAPGSGTGQVMLRPEQLRPVPVSAGLGGVPGRVVRTSFHGHDALVIVQLDDAELATRVPAPLTLAAGDEVSLLVTGPGVFYPAVAQQPEPALDQ
jgi:iron(III) transport system ATP-binding protein